MNNHEYFFELINLKIDNTLTAEQKLELDEHLLSCTECADRLRTYELLHDFRMICWSLHLRALEAVS